MNFEKIPESTRFLIIGLGLMGGSYARALKKQGYTVEAKYVTIDTDAALARNQKRYDDAKANYDAGLSTEPPRLPNPKMVTECHAKVTDISVSMAPKFDKIEVWDNNGGKGEQHIIATGGKGKGLTVVPGQQSDFNRFLSKSKNGLDGFMTLPDGQVVPVKGD